MALLNIVLKDGANVDQTFEVFTPQVGRESAILVNKVAGITAGFQRLQLLTRRGSTNSSGSYVIQGTLMVPFDKGPVGGPSKWVTAHADFKVSLPDELAAADRATVASYIKTALANTQVQNAIANLLSFA